MGTAPDIENKHPQFVGNITINGIQYYQPECNCKGTRHICYLRPVAQVINMKLDKLTLGSGGNAESPKNQPNQEGE